MEPEVKGKGSGLRATDFTKEQRFLLAKKDLFPKQTANDLATGKIRFVDSDINHTAEITSAGGIYDLLRSDNDQVVGLSDFDSNKLATGVNATIGRIKVGYAKIATASLGTKTAADMSYSSKISAFPAELLRAKLIIKQDNKVLARLPIERFTNSADSTQVQGEEDVLHLGSPIMLIEQKPINIQLEFNPNQGIIAGTDTHFIQIRLMGTETAAK